MPINSNKRKSNSNNKNQNFSPKKIKLTANQTDLISDISDQEFVSEKSELTPTIEPIENNKKRKSNPDFEANNKTAKRSKGQEIFKLSESKFESKQYPNLRNTILHNFCRLISDTCTAALLFNNKLFIASNSIYTSTSNKCAIGKSVIENIDRNIQYFKSYYEACRDDTDILTIRQEFFKSLSVSIIKSHNKGNIQIDDHDLEQIAIKALKSRDISNTRDQCNLTRVAIINDPAYRNYDRKHLASAFEDLDIYVKSLRKIEKFIRSYPNSEFVNAMIGHRFDNILTHEYESILFKDYNLVHDDKRPGYVILAMCQKPKDNLKIHAELKILLYLSIVRIIDKNHSFYIGTSKGICPDCNRKIEAFNNYVHKDLFISRGKHPSKSLTKEPDSFENNYLKDRDLVSGFSIRGNQNPNHNKIVYHEIDELENFNDYASDILIYPDEILIKKVNALYLNKLPSNLITPVKLNKQSIYDISSTDVTPLKAEECLKTFKNQIDKMSVSQLRIELSNEIKLMENDSTNKSHLNKIFIINETIEQISNASLIKSQQSKSNTGFISKQVTSSNESFSSRNVSKELFSNNSSNEENPEEDINSESLSDECKLTKKVKNKFSVNSTDIHAKCNAYVNKLDQDYYYQFEDIDSIIKQYISKELIDDKIVMSPIGNVSDIITLATVEHMLRVKKTQLLNDNIDRIIGTFCHDPSGSTPHWVAFMITHSDQIGCVVYYKDSLGSFQTPTFSKLFKKIFGDSTKFIHHKGHEQNDGSSCGIYALKNVEQFAIWSKETLNTFTDIEFNRMKFFSANTQQLRAEREKLGNIYNNQANVARNDHEDLIVERQITIVKHDDERLELERLLNSNLNSDFSCKVKIRSNGDNYSKYYYKISSKSSLIELNTELGQYFKVKNTEVFYGTYKKTSEAKTIVIIKPKHLKTMSQTVKIVNFRDRVSA